MKYIIKLSILVFVVIFTSACSSKQYYEPKDVKTKEFDTKDINSTIKTFNSTGATLTDGKFIAIDGISKITLPKNYKFLNDINGTILASDLNQTLLIQTNQKQTKLHFKQNVIAASLHKNNLALIFRDNSIGLYDISSKSFILRKYRSASILNDIKIANPIFVDNLALYPSLDGNIVVVNIPKKLIVRNINIDPQSQINNIIFLQNINDTIVAATPNTLMVLGDGVFSIKQFSINSICAVDGYIYIATLDGDIIKFDLMLEKLTNKKLRFAKILTLFGKKNIYALESQGFLIKLDTNLSKSTVYELDLDDELKTFSTNNRLYFDTNYIDFK
jgi:hypothetical protein